MATPLHFDQQAVQQICKNNDVEFLGVFGSVARGEEKKGSDIDMLVKFASGSKASLLDLVGMEFALQDAIGRSVDLVTEGFLSPYIRDQVMADIQPIYGRLA